MMNFGLKMESWNFMSEGGGVYLSEELDFRYDNHVYNKSKLVGLCESKPLLNVDNYPQVFEKSDFVEMGLCDKISKPYSISSEPSREVFRNGIGINFGNVGEEKICCSKIASTDSIRSNDKELSVVDLKLGRLEGELAETNVSGSWIESSSQAKKSRLTSSYSQSPKCQVLGCNKDLGSYKGYYRRHKVCKEHTRTAVVTVNGLKQRFCQQCSRFHQVAEFDDDKRSCRKRLAVHNNRRRKPRLSSDESGTGIINFSSSYAFSDSLPITTTTTDPSNLEELKRAEHVKIEDPIEISDIFFHVSGISENSKDIPLDVKHSIVSMSTSTILNSSNFRQTSPALSLLSAQSRDVSKDVVQNGFHETEMYSTEADDVGNTMSTHCESNTVDPLLLGDDILRESDVRNIPLGDGIILDLHQLSTRLHRIEQKKLSTESEVG